MDMNEYQKKAISTAIYPEVYEIVYPTLGLAGESGEIAEKVKKVLRDDIGDFSKDSRKEIAKELGDVLWYVALLARDLGFDLEEVAEMNVQKLASRKERNKLGGSGDNR